MTKTLNGFKVGDRVRLVDDALIEAESGLFVGDVGLVREVRDASLLVKFPGAALDVLPDGTYPCDPSHVVRCKTVRRYTPAQLAAKLRKLVASVDAETWAQLERTIVAAARA